MLSFVVRVAIIPVQILGTTSGTGTHTTGIVRCDQPRVLDLKAGNGKRLERAPYAVMYKVLARLVLIFL